MRFRLVVTTAQIRELHWLLLDNPDGTLLPAGVARTTDGTDVLLPVHGDAAMVGDAAAVVRVFRLPPGLEGSSHLLWQALPSPSPRGRLHVELALHDGRGCSAAVFADGIVHRLHEVVLAGPGMEVWVPGALPPALRGAVPADGLHSRYAGALGGKSVHDRLRQLPCLGIAAARLGSAMSMALAKAGCPLVIADPDELELHSTDAIDCFPSPGDSKVDAVARFVRAAAPWTTITPLAVSAEAPEVLAAARSCRLIYSCPDRDDARFAASLLAVALHRVHIDLGTGVFEQGGAWRAGADIRLVLPGEGCLLCVGGLDLGERPPVDWRRQRAGSLRSLNHLAVSIAMLQLERLVVGDLTRSTWTRVEVAADGMVTTRAMPVTPAPDCLLCGRWAGAGDHALVAG